MLVYVVPDGGRWSGWTFVRALLPTEWNLRNIVLFVGWLLFC